MADLQPAYFGLIGTLIGAAISPLTVIALKAFDVRRADSKSKEYLAIRVCSRLRSFAAACVEVSYDSGRPDAGGFYIATTKEPVFDPEVPDIDWKSLTPKLSYPIHDLRDRVAEAMRFVAAAAEDTNPPEFSEVYEERQYQFTKLGLRAIELADLLHIEANLPERTLDRMDLKAYLETNIVKLEAARTARATRNQQFLQMLEQQLKQEKKPDQT
ncbi:hypothetical protein D9M72_278020 [compost metagenome]